MKTKFNLLGILFGCIFTFALQPQKAMAQQNYVSFQVFYDELSPYGDWINYSKYGYVWIPDAGPNFVPYSSQGHWIYTNYGWTWVSNYNWGWAPFHYGRWAYDDFLGWFWVPDNNWGPSWVTWVNCDGYYGWQPMQPGVSISLSFGHNYHNNYNHWVFVRYNDFERNDLHNYCVQRDDRFIRNTRVIDRTYTDRTRRTTYVSGPSRSEVQRSTGRRIRPVVIEENQRPGQELNNGRLSIYRPDIRRSVNPDQKAAPRKVYDINDVKRPIERSSAIPNENNRQERSTNTTNPSNNENRSVPYQQKTETQYVPNSRPLQQERAITPQNEYRQVQPTQQRSADSPSNNTRTYTTKSVTPQNENRQAQPSQSRNETQSGSTKQEQSPQQRSVDPPANLRPVNQTKTVVPESVNRRVEQPTQKQETKPVVNTSRNKSANETKPKSEQKREVKKESDNKDNKRR